MTNLVVDASVAIKWFLPEPYSPEARRILDDFGSGGLSIQAPDLIHAEVGNILWKKQTFHGLSAGDAKTIICRFGELPITIAPTRDLLETAYALAETHKRTVYDSLYLALMIRESCRFVTADEKLVNAVSSSFPSVIWLANWR